MLRLSLIVNLALAWVVAWALVARGRPPKPDGALQHLTNRVLRTRKVVVESPLQVLTVTAPFHWSGVESADYRVYMANLRAIGCPERTVREIIVADVDQLFLERVRELFYPLNNRVWWLLANQDQAKELGDRVEKDWDALMDQRKAVLKELISREEPYARDEAEAEIREHARWAHTLDFLSPEKQDQVLTVRKTTETAIRELWVADQQHQKLTKEERADRQRQQRELEAGRDQQLSALLTPEELAEYQLRTSQGAEVRQRLSRIEFSEDEIRAIARLNNERRQLEGQVSGDNPESRQRKMEVARQTDAQLKETLGATRYADYVRASDGRFEQISQVTERFGLPEATAVSVYDLQLEAQARAAQVRSDSALPAEESQALQQAIRDETERSLKATLGDKVFATLERRGGAGWLAGLTKPDR